MKKAFYLIFTISLLLSCCLSAQVNIIKSDEKIEINGKLYYLHTVSAGETFYSISRAYNVKIEDIYESNPDLSENLQIDYILRIPIHKEEDKSKNIIHIVKQGETLYSLIRKYEISEDYFYKLNPDIKKSSVINVGQELLFPVKLIEIEEEFKEDFQERDTLRFIYHKLIEGETLYSLSRKYNVSIEQILKANYNIDETNLPIGKEVLIPRTDDFPIEEKHRIIDSLARISFDFIIPQDEDSLELKTYLEDSISLPCDSLILSISKKFINISVLLPFEAEANMNQLKELIKNNRELQIMSISERMISFVYGCLIALSNFDTINNIEINFNLYDVGRNNLVIQKLIEDGTIDNSDLIIGPAFRSQIVYLAENRKSNKSIIVLPFSSDNSYIEKYENIFMIKTSSFYEIKGIVDYSINNPQNNYLIAYENTNESIKFADMFLNKIEKASLKNNISNASAKKILFNGNKLENLNQLLVEDKNNIIISTITGEYKTFRIFTQLFPITEYEISIIGSKDILDYTTIDPKYFLDNNFIYYSSNNIDYTKEETKNFVLNFREEFFTEPDYFSFIGYDIINIFTQGLIYYGNQITNCLKFVENKGLSGKIIFTRENYFAPNSYSNKKIYLYSLDERYNFNIVYPKENNQETIIDD